MPLEAQVGRQMRRMHAAHAERQGRLAKQQRRKTSMDPYFSRLTWLPTLAGAGPFTYTIAAGSARRAFGYAQLADMAAGGNSGVTATEVDTNITTASKTIGGRSVLIRGISVQIGPSSRCASLAALIFSETSVRLQFNGLETNLLMGNMYMIPGSSGLYGFGEDLSLIPAIAGGERAFRYSNNGLPGRDNIMRVPEGIIWQSEGEVDSSMVIAFGTQRQCQVSAPADEAAAAGIRGYTHPTAAAMTLDVMVQLHGYVVGPRSHTV